MSPHPPQRKAPCPHTSLATKAAAALSSHSRMRHSGLRAAQLAERLASGGGSGRTGAVWWMNLHGAFKLKGGPESGSGIKGGAVWWMNLGGKPPHIK